MKGLLKVLLVAVVIFWISVPAVASPPSDTPYLVYVFAEGGQIVDVGYVLTGPDGSFLAYFGGQYYAGGWQLWADYGTMGASWDAWLDFTDPMPPFESLYGFLLFDSQLLVAEAWSRDVDYFLLGVPAY